MNDAPFPHIVAPSSPPPPLGWSPWTPQNRKERRTHLKKLLGMANGASIVCSISAGLGMAVGLMDHGSGYGGIPVAIVAAGALTTVLWAGWHGTLKAASRVREPLAYAGTLGAAVLCAGVAAGASSWPVASVLSGPAALRTYQNEVAAAQAKAEAAAWAEAQKESAVIVETHDAGLAWKAAANAEIKGGSISGSAGNGPVAIALMAQASRFEEQEQRQEELWAAVKRLHFSMTDLTQRQRAAIGKDSEAFEGYSGQIASIIKAENAFHLTQMVANGGLVDIRTATNNRGMITRVEMIEDAVTKKMRRRIKEIEADRREIEVVNYMPMESRDAVKEYALTSALAGWVTALSIDLAPLMFVVLLLCGSRDPNITQCTEEEATPAPHPDGVPANATGRPTFAAA